MFAWVAGFEQAHWGCHMLQGYTFDVAGRQVHNVEDCNCVVGSKVAAECS